MSNRPESALSQALRRFASRSEAAPLAFLVLFAIGAAITTPAFTETANLLSIVAQVAVIGIVALAVNTVILTGEIDVSTGSLLAACSLVFGLVANSYGGVLVPLLAACALGLFVGFVNGCLVTLFRVPSIIVTLGMLMIIRGIVLSLAKAGTVILPQESRELGLGDVLGLPTPVVILAVATLLFLLVIGNTALGRNVLAVGGNERAARLVGLPTRSVKLSCFVATGLCCAIASAIFFGQIGQLQAQAANGFELKVIAAVVLGGTSILGGRGSVFAPILGAILVGAILNALTLNSVPETYEQLILGSLILIAIVFDALRYRLTGGTT
jgi:ribose/xylose/arabinose/galactoside ABC-type transport system permease subunit